MNRLLVLVCSLGMLSAWGQESNSRFSTAAPPHPIELYISQMDAQGRILSRWGDRDSTGTSWFFASYAMVMTRNLDRKDTDPFSGMEALVPEIWSDLKNFSPRTLVEVAGGALSSSELMALDKHVSLGAIPREERLILHVAGFSHLRMLQESIPDSVFQKIIETSIANSRREEEITDALLASIARYTAPSMAQQFQILLDSGQWIDVELESVSRLDSGELLCRITYKTEPRFPFDLLAVTSSGDSLRYAYTDIDNPWMTLPRGDIVAVELDPQHRLSEYYRFNNKWPRMKGHVQIQPFFALPDWESYRIVVSPATWSDWDGEKRYGVKLSSGFGIDLWPAYPSDYRHRMSVELNAHAPVSEQVTWGARFSYGHPLRLEHRLFLNYSMHHYDDWEGVSIGLTRYVGKQTFLVQGSRLNYQRLMIKYDHDRYGDPDIWGRKQKVDLVKAELTGLSLTRFGDRLYVRMRAAAGVGPDGGFNIARGQADLSGVFWNLLVGGFQLVGGSQSANTPAPYNFTHTYAWQDGLSVLPNFRGQTKLNGSTHAYLGLSMSAGYWISWIQIKLFSSSMLYAGDGVGVLEAKPRHAAGFGFEHKSIFTAGVYFPIWQSVPLDGEPEWKWRYQWRFTWNL